MKPLSYLRWYISGAYYALTAPFRDAYHAIARKYWRKYNVIKPRKLGDAWVDKDELMIHAVFEVFCQFYEQSQKVVGGLEGSDKEKERLTELYNWWINDGYNTDYPFNMSDEEYKAKFSPGSGNDPWEEASKNRQDARNKCKELIDLSEHFWY